jgi:hypothetical protein
VPQPPEIPGDKPPRLSASAKKGTTVAGFRYRGVEADATDYVLVIENRVCPACLGSSHLAAEPDFRTWLKLTGLCDRAGNVIFVE